MEVALKHGFCSYKRMEPEQDLLHQVLREHLETFLDLTQTSEHALPGHVEQELRITWSADFLRMDF